AGGRAGEVGPKQDPALLEYRRLGAIEILRGLLPLDAERPLGRGQDSPAEPEGATAGIVDREHQPPAEPLARVVGRLFRPADEPGPLELLERVTRLAGPRRQPLTGVRGVAEMEPLNARPSNAPLSQIGDNLGRPCQGFGECSL